MMKARFNFKCLSFKSRNRPTISHISAPSKLFIPTLKIESPFFVHRVPSLKSNDFFACKIMFLSSSLMSMYSEAKSRALFRRFSDMEASKTSN
jgi:hypothetical protein